ncbi:NADH-quinone oxidoreductase subunit A [Ferrimicrobium acidiphilum]|uniref:NADH-quinone oxidoreductase subunit n=1 Tax=Ferrimicrobium acidiphilum DSM 19497 TaxID=1121877 RepID=A0A0D8FWX6_9ACTN|nr:NADH-quinone oxidoreductase subunit A [Ferrimicrobium acidiphilum]KJE77671.1 NADH-quinone oxidoreductase subunit 7 [Ferrimicrobium acidiphilum DSM 19497]
MTQYLPIVVMLVLGALFASGSFVASGLFAPRRPHRAKSAPYECGIVPRSEVAERFPVRFYLVAMIFIIFDIEIIFLYPFAAAAGALGTFGVIEIATFALVVFIAFAYLVANGALSWGPKRGASVDTRVAHRVDLGELTASMVRGGRG